MTMRPQNKYLKPFPKGVSGNPSGRPKGYLTKAQVEAMFQKFSVKNREELQAVVEDKKSSMLEIMIASVMIKAAKDGDYQRVQFLLDRAIGKVKDVVEQTNIDGGVKDLVDSVSTDDLLKLVVNDKP